MSKTMIQAIKEAAKLYNTSKEFEQYNNRLYLFAAKRGMLQTLFPNEASTTIEIPDNYPVTFKKIKGKDLLMFEDPYTSKFYEVKIREITTQNDIKQYQRN